MMLQKVILMTMQVTDPFFGEDDEWVAGNYASKAENSPFTGWKLPGRVHFTICAGKVVYHA